MYDFQRNGLFDAWYNIGVRHRRIFVNFHEKNLLICVFIFLQDVDKKCHMKCEE